MNKLVAFLTAVTLVYGFSPRSMAGDEDPKDAKDAKTAVSDESQRMMNSTTTLEEVIGIPEDGIPQTMFDKSAAIVVIPGLVKAGFIVGAKRGEGVMSIRSKEGWTHPAFVNLTGGSIGWQAGVSSTDLILVFMSEKNVKALLNGEFTLGADAAVAAGPVGREASAGTNLSVKAEVYSYSRSRGLFAGIAIDGSQLGIDNDATARYYGKGMTAQKVLYESHDKTPKSADRFKRVLNNLTKIGAAVGGTTGALIGAEMDKRAAELRKDLEGAKVERVGEGIKITFDSGVLFDVDKATLRPVAQTNIANLAAVLNKYADTDIMIEGDTDNTGTEEYNVALSKRRAQSVADYLASLSVARARIGMVGLGETNPVASNDTEYGRQQNRRVEFAIFANDKLKVAAEAQVGTR